MVVLCGLSDSKSPQVSRSLLSWYFLSYLSPCLLVCNLASWSLEISSQLFFLPFLFPRFYCFSIYIYLASAVINCDNYSFFSLFNVALKLLHWYIYAILNVSESSSSFFCSHFILEEIHFLCLDYRLLGNAVVFSSEIFSFHNHLLVCNLASLSLEISIRLFFLTIILY